MYYADIKNVDVANGPGVRVSLFVSGCTHRCKDCFNPESWDFSYGKPFDEEASAKLMALLEPVSYTHLDVYKRQIPGFQIDAESVLWGPGRRGSP